MNTTDALPRVIRGSSTSLGKVELIIGRGLVVHRPLLSPRGRAHAPWGLAYIPIEQPQETMMIVAAGNLETNFKPSQTRTARTCQM